MENLEEHVHTIKPQNHGHEIDPRRFSIYFKIDDQDPVCISNLRVRDYLRLKNNNAEALHYCRMQFAPRGINKLWRSLDDVEYSLIYFDDED